MGQRLQILITGSDGFIGRALTNGLEAIGDVWGISRRSERRVRVLRANLLNFDETRAAIQSGPSFDVVIHLAALAHGQRPSGTTMFAVNTSITANIVKALGSQAPHFIYASSVSVYGEDQRQGPVEPGATPRPFSEYGRSKQQCEKLILDTELPHVDVLRVAPVYDEARMVNARKRVFLPGTPLRIKLSPPSQMSLCHTDTLIRTVIRLVLRGPAGRSVNNVADEIAYSQNIVADWFQGPSLVIPVIVTRPLYWIACGLPGRFGYAWRCLYWKFFNSNVYLT